MTEIEAVSGVGPAAAKKLRDAFVTTAELLAVQNPVELEKKTKLGEGTIKNIINNAMEITGHGIFKTGREIEVEEAKATRLLTGVEGLDDKLLGGFPEGSLIELYGPAAGGKTQWCAHLAIRAQLPLDEGGLAGRVLWMDTEKSFRTWTIRANAIRFGLDSEVAIDNVERAKYLVTAQMQNTFEVLPQLIIDNGIKMVIVDSLSGLFRAEFKGLAQLPLRQREMLTMVNEMRKMGSATGAVFVYTNQVQEKISKLFSASNQPIGGHILSHGSDFRFYTAGKNTDRKILLKDNAGVPPFEVKLKFGWGGFYETADELVKNEKRVVKRLKEIDHLGYRDAVEEMMKEKEAEIEVEAS